MPNLIYIMSSLIGLAMGHTVSIFLQIILAICLQSQGHGVSWLIGMFLSAMSLVQWISRLGLNVWWRVQHLQDAQWLSFACQESPGILRKACCRQSGRSGGTDSSEPPMRKLWCSDGSYISAQMLLRIVITHPNVPQGAPRHNHSSRPPHIIASYLLPASEQLLVIIRVGVGVRTRVRFIHEFD